MARGSSYGEKPSLEKIPQTPQLNIPRRATRQLEAVNGKEEQETAPVQATTLSVGNPVIGMKDSRLPLPRISAWRSRRWELSWIICSLVVILSLIIVITAGIYQRAGAPNMVSSAGLQAYPVQVGGTLDAIITWENSNGPLPTKKPIPTNAGPYSVLGKPTITVDFINQVLAAYGSPAAGTGQALYDYGVKYNIDPTFALAFFLHESGFGTAGVARTTLSLGNLRCIPDVPCYQYNGGYAQFSSWEQGYEAWYKLIRNLYVAQWGLVTVDQIIPKYAPSSDNNNEAAYISSLKSAIDTWHAGIIHV